MLVITAFPPKVIPTTRETALARNRLVLALAAEIVVPHVAVGSPLSGLLAERALGDVHGHHPSRSLRDFGSRY
jgi:hypothetical protein